MTSSTCLARKGTQNNSSLTLNVAEINFRMNTQYHNFLILFSFTCLRTRWGFLNGGEETHEKMRNLFQSGTNYICTQKKLVGAFRGNLPNSAKVPLPDGRKTRLLTFLKPCCVCLS